MPQPAPVVQVFGLSTDQAAPAELRRFVERLGAAAVLDETARAYREAGLGYLNMDDAGIVARLLADPSLLRLPLVRHGDQVSVGRAEATWKAWLAARPVG